MYKLFLILSLFGIASTSGIASTYGSKCSEKKIEERDILYWIANPANLIDPTTKNCSEKFLANFSKYHNSISSLGPYLWKPNVINSSHVSVIPTPNVANNCYNELINKYPYLTLAASGGISECWNNNCEAKVMGRNPDFFINSLSNFIQQFPTHISDVWFDFETKYINSNDTININTLFNKLSQSVSVYRYAGCVHNGEPAYLNETCKDFTVNAPRVVVQGAGTYWDNSPIGFKKIFLDMVSDIGTENINRLSVAVCPCCDNYDQITQEELYDRMDMLCEYNITSISAFTLDEILQLYGVNNTGGRWMNAFAYYKTGIKQ